MSISHSCSCAGSSAGYTVRTSYVPQTEGKGEKLVSLPGNIFNLTLTPLYIPVIYYLPWREKDLIWSISILLCRYRNERDVPKFSIGSLEYSMMTRRGNSVKKIKRPHMGRKEYQKRDPWHSYLWINYVVDSNHITKDENHRDG